MKKIYFAGSIRGGRSDVLIYEKIINLLGSYGEVLTEHVGNKKLLEQEKVMSDKEIHDRDVEWLKKCSVVVAEVTQPSLGVGYELCKAMYLDKKVLCLFNSSKGGKLSAMIEGQPYFDIVYYQKHEELKEVLHNFFN